MSWKQFSSLASYRQAPHVYYDNWNNLSSDEQDFYQNTHEVQKKAWREEGEEANTNKMYWKWVKPKIKALMHQRNRWDAWGRNPEIFSKMLYEKKRQALVRRMYPRKSTWEEQKTANLRVNRKYNRGFSKPGGIPSSQERSRVNKGFSKPGGLNGYQAEKLAAADYDKRKRLQKARIKQFHVKGLMLL